MEGGRQGSKLRREFITRVGEICAVLRPERPQFAGVAAGWGAPGPEGLLLPGLGPQPLLRGARGARRGAAPAPAPAAGQAELLQCLGEHCARDVLASSP